jgi:hypothetical protein
MLRVNKDAYDWFEKLRKKYGFLSRSEFLLRLLNMTEHYNIKFYRSDK